MIPPGRPVRGVEMSQAGWVSLCRRERRKRVRRERAKICGADVAIVRVFVCYERGETMHSLDALWRLTAGGPTVAQRHAAAMDHLRSLDPARLP